MKNGQRTMDAPQAIYLFCFARSNLLPAIQGKGVDGQNPLFLWGSSDIVAVLGVVSLEEFCGPLAEPKMQDLAWVGPRACYHEEVIERIMRYSPVLPARFGTLFSSLESLEQLLREHYNTISQFLDRMVDKEEWAIKGLLDKTRAKKKLFSVKLAELEGHLSSSPGIRYFQEQRIWADVEKELNHWLKETCKEIAKDLSRYVVDFCEHKVLFHRVEGDNRDRILDWAFLIPRNAVMDLQAWIDQMNANFIEQGLVFKLSGPWPPYSFSPSLLIAPET
ncbi:MAG: GvpL/GvpF family gas vesicle protein [Nitrospira sp.]|nr:GvpL/GvpF family gas vesicle protein [Nitrospira sp.]